MCEECASSIPDDILLGCSGYGHAVGCVDDTTRNYNQEITFLGGCLIYNDDDVYGGRVRVKILVRVLSDMCK